MVVICFLLLGVVRLVWCCCTGCYSCVERGVCGEECVWRGKATHDQRSQWSLFFACFACVCVFFANTTTENNWTKGSAVCGEISTWWMVCGVGCDGSQACDAHTWRGWVVLLKLLKSAKFCGATEVAKSCNFGPQVCSRIHSSRNKPRAQCQFGCWV